MDALRATKTEGWCGIEIPFSPFMIWINVSFIAFSERIVLVAIIKNGDWDKAIP